MSLAARVVILAGAMIVLAPLAVQIPLHSPVVAIAQAYAAAPGSFSRGAAQQAEER